MLAQGQNWEPRPDHPVWQAMRDEQIRGRLQNVTRRIALSAPDADDAFQEAMVQALVHADRFRADSMVSTWLHRIVVNAALMGRRRSAVWKNRLVRQGGEARVSGLQEDEVTAANWPEIRDATPSPEQQLEQREEREQLWVAISRLPPRSRRTIQDFLEAGNGSRTDDEEVQREPKDISPNALRARLSRARSRLKELVTSVDIAMPRTV